MSLFLLLCRHYHGLFIYLLIIIFEGKSANKVQAFLQFHIKTVTAAHFTTMARRRRLNSFLFKENLLS